MHVFTSITANYLPKARVLASSLKRFHPDAIFHLVLADEMPADFHRRNVYFDHVLTMSDLPIPDMAAWTFKHSVVELCTAVKGIAALEIQRRHGASHLYYLDPDIAVFGALDGLEALLEQHGILLTPHLTEPDGTLTAIVDNEICTLQHGIYNLGFFGVSAAEEGKRFLEWSAHRLFHFCYDDIPGGLFTDQRWADFTPAFFPTVGIVREPQYNVATWNLNNRLAAGKAPYDIHINGRPLGFFHFSGFDSGAQEAMLKLYGAASPVLFDLRDWYVAECERMGQSREGRQPCVYSVYEDGTVIPRAHRILYRTRPDLQAMFPNPYATRSPQKSYLNWVHANAEALTTIPDANYRLQVQDERLQVQGQRLEVQNQRLQSLLAELERDSRIAILADDSGLATAASNLDSARTCLEARSRPLSPKGISANSR